MKGIWTGVICRAAALVLILAANLSLLTICIARPEPGQEKGLPPARLAVSFQSGIRFGRAEGHQLVLDLAAPQQQGGGPYPAVVCIHGGGWVGGSRSQMEQTIRVLAGRGYVAIAPDYRLAPTARFPAQIEDCKAAVRWLRAHASQYHIDPDRIGAMGLAAGGHLACLLGVTEGEDELEGPGGNREYSSRVQAVVSFCAPTDLTQSVWNHETISGNLVPLLGGTPAQVPEAYRRASVVSYVGRKRNPPPFLLLHGTADPVVPYRQAQVLAARLEQAGGEVRVVPLVEAGHGWGDRALLESIARMVLFLDEHLRP